MNAHESHRNGPLEGDGVMSGPTRPLWCIQWPGGRDYRPTEPEANALADWLVKSKTTGIAAVFRVDEVVSEGAA